jgi:hypothetical protein
VVQDWPQRKTRSLSEKITKAKMVGGVAQMVEHKIKALSSNPVGPINK